MVIMQEIKIGVVASMLMLEIVSYYYKQNKDLFDVLEDIYMKYGYYIEKGESIVLKGIEGKEKITKKMDSLRNTDITEIEGVKVLKTRDYEKIEELVFETNAEDIEKTDSYIKVITSADDFNEIEKYLESKGIDFIETKLDFVPDNDVEITDFDNALKFKKMIEAFDEDEDVKINEL